MTLTIEVQATKAEARALLAELIEYAIKVEGATVTGGGVA